MPLKLLTSKDFVIGTTGTLASASPHFFNLGAVSTIIAIMVGVLTAGFLVSRWALWAYTNRAQLSEINHLIVKLIKSAFKCTKDDE